MTATLNLPEISAQQLATMLDQLRAKSCNQSRDQQSRQDQCDWEACVAELNRRRKANPDDPELMAILDSQFLQSADSEFIPPLPLEIDSSKPSDPDSTTWRDAIRGRIGSLNYARLSELLQTCDSRIALLRRAFPNPKHTGSWQNSGAVRQRLRQFECLRNVIVAEMCRKEPDLDTAGASSGDGMTKEPAMEAPPAWKLDRGQRADRLYEELRIIARACKELKATNEAVFRKRFRQFQLWIAIDNSSISERAREQFFAHKFPAKAGYLECFGFIGQVMGVSGHTIYNDRKLYRKAHRDRATANKQSESQSNL